MTFFVAESQRQFYGVAAYLFAQITVVISHYTSVCVFWWLVPDDGLN